MLKNDEEYIKVEYIEDATNAYRAEDIEFKSHKIDILSEATVEDIYRRSVGKDIHGHKVIKHMLLMNDYITSATVIIPNSDISGQIKYDVDWQKDDSLAVTLEV